MVLRRVAELNCLNKGNPIIGSLFRWDRPAGRLVRAPLRLLPKGLTVPILSGQNRGRLWVVGSGTHACWLGTYERRKLDDLCRFVQPGMVVFDVGAHAGFYTLAFSRLVGPRGRVVAFEPHAPNAARLQRHLALNGIANVDIVPAAVSDRAGTERFAGNDDSYQGRIAEDGIEVPCVRLDDYPLPGLIKMDIEGGEGPALAGAAGILARKATHVFVALHGVSDEQTLAELGRHDYRIRYLGSDELHASPPDGRPFVSSRKDSSGP